MQDLKPSGRIDSASTNQPGSHLVVLRKDDLGGLTIEEATGALWAQWWCANVGRSPYKGLKIGPGDVALIVTLTQRAVEQVLDPARAIDEALERRLRAQPTKAPKRKGGKSKK